MKLRVIWVGKTKDRRLAELASDYTLRIRRFLPIEIAELKDSRHEYEPGKILACIDASDRLIALEAGGRSWSSEKFAAFVGNHMRQDPRRLTFVIGGPAGLHDSVRKRADLSWSLSPLTFTHDIARVLLLEQIYRALTIIHNHPYPR